MSNKLFKKKKNKKINFLQLKLSYSDYMFYNSRPKPCH